MAAPSPDTSAIAGYLRRRPYFARLAPEQLAALARDATLRSFEPGEVLFFQDEPSAGLWIVESGSIKVFRLAPDGREHVMHLLGPGDTFNEIPALDGGPNAASAAAIAAARAWIIGTPAVAAALAADHGLALAVVQSLAGRVRQLVLLIEDLALRSVTARLARFLVEQTENPALKAPGITRALVATHLATTPETVSRALHTLELAGAIRFDRHRIVIVRLDLLRELAML